MSRFQAVIFDLDGTILDTLEDIQSAVNHVLNENGFPARDLDFVRRAVGNGMRKLICRSLPPSRQEDNALIDRCTAQMKEYYLTHWSEKTQPYSGIRELLCFLKESGIPAAVLTNKPDAAAKRMVPHWYGDVPFACVLGDRDGVPRKPDPTVALAIARQLDAEPERVLLVGDSSPDVMTAKNAGMVSAGVLWGFRSERELREAGADFIAHTPQDLIRLIQERE